MISNLQQDQHLTGLEKELNTISHDKESHALSQRIIRLLKLLWQNKKFTFNRSLPFGEYFVDRHEKAPFLGFGKGTAGVQIYSHDSVEWAIIGGKTSYQYANTGIEDNCYIGPNTIIQKGVRIGKGSIIGANSFVNQSIPPHSKYAGSPAKNIDATPSPQHEEYMQ